MRAIDTNLAGGIVWVWWLQLVEGQEGDLPTHLVAVHGGEDLRSCAVCVHHNVEQPEQRQKQ